MKKMIFLISALLFLAVNNGHCVEDKVVAVVNNEVITKAELDTYINLLKLQTGYEGWLKSGMTEKNALESLVEDRLILQEAKNKKIGADDRFIESRLQRMKSKFSSEDEFSDFLMQQGVSLSELRESLKGQMLSENLITEEIRNKIFVSPAEVTKYYQEHLTDFYTPERSEVESILVGDKKQAQQIYARLKEGANFTELQKQYSKSSNLGIINRGQLRKELEGVIFSLGVGKFSQPIEISEGYYIFFVRNKFAPAEKELVEVQKNISDMLFEEKFNIKLKDWLGKLKGKSYIVIKDE